MAAVPATIADVIARAPELEAASLAQPAAFQLTLDDALCLLDQACWGDALDKAHANLSAHWLTVQFNPAGVGGVVTSRRIDKIQESYSVGAFADSELATTKYGRRYLAMLKQLETSFSTAVSDGNDPPDFSLPDERIL